MAKIINLKQCSPLSPQTEHPHRHIPHLERYPAISVQKDALNASAHFSFNPYIASPRNVLIPVTETVLKRITRTFFESGFKASLIEARNEQTREEAPWISNAGDMIAQFLDLYKTVRLKVFPHAQELSVQRITKYAQARDWMNADIRYIAWHLHLFKIAVACHNDQVRVYIKIGVPGSPVTIIKSPTQTQITCMSWRPLCSQELAVGCREGVCIWLIDSNTQFSRGSHAPNHILKHPNQLPITALEWGKDGMLLITASIGDSSILIWEPDRSSDAPLMAIRRMGPPLSLLKWSPNNENLFVGSVDKVFRVWNCNQWTDERWVCREGNMQAACWSPCGRYLVFANTSDPVLYSLQFGQKHLLFPGKEDNEVTPIADLDACPVDDKKHYFIGGIVQQMAWDPRGNFLVISFMNTSFVAIIRTFVRQFDLQLAGVFYVSGEQEYEYPNFICFQPIYDPNECSILTIGWSSGRIQYYPFN